MLSYYQRVVVLLVGKPDKSKGSCFRDRLALIRITTTAKWKAQRHKGKANYIKIRLMLPNDYFIKKR